MAERGIGVFSAAGEGAGVSEEDAMNFVSVGGGDKSEGGKHPPRRKIARRRGRSIFFIKGHSRRN